jgi:hypothetical protein
VNFFMPEFSRLNFLRTSAVGLLATVTGALFPGRASAQVPTAGLHYQGRLTSPDGTPVADGSYDVTFTLFDAPDGGASWWTESSTVATRSGAFATMLGRIQPFAPGVFNRPLWLEITISGRKLAPRQELGASAYAMTALGVRDGAVTGTMIAAGTITGDRLVDHTITEKQLAPGISVPIGGVIPWWGDSGAPPDGWAVCDGHTLSDSSSPLNGLPLPDLRDRFVRGATGNVRSAPIAGGSATIDLSHSHTVNDHSHGINDDLAIGSLKALGHNHSLPNNQVTGDEASNGKDGGFNGSGFLLMIRGDASKSEQWLGHSHGGSTNSAAPGTNSALPNGQSILPPYLGLVYILRVR